MNTSFTGKKRHPQTPNLHTILPTRLSEIAYWFLRNPNDRFTKRQMGSAPDIYHSGDDPRNYDNLVSLLREDDESYRVLTHSIPESMRMGLIIEAVVGGCRNTELLEYLRKDPRLTEWIQTLVRLRAGAIRSDDRARHDKEGD